MDKVKKWSKEIVLGLVILVAFSLFMDWLRKPNTSPLVTQTSLITLGGDPVTVDKLSKEKPLLLYVWGSWCSICNYTSPTVDTLAKEGVNVMSLALRSGDDARVTRYLEHKGVNLPVINDPEGRIASQMAIGATPTFAIFYQGKLVQSTSGWTSGLGLKLRLWLATL
ncbi:protein disulfide oxidoreductase [Dongshaea marina]|uniref:protein disulfide oxidoreductase n=1 Tax=Dongshaea marina TaxID=2047966 RepID=UPI000D3E7D43|nr:protein disulfide oxidoreductase [Dongshaea marina]